MKSDESSRGRAIVASGVKMAGRMPEPEYKSLGKLEREDIVILFLSVILVIATLWLATEVL
jgi:hypothetical protein